MAAAISGHVASHHACRVSPGGREVLVCTMEGCTNHRITAKLGISHCTVDLHRSNATRKLGVNRFCEVAYDFCLLLACEATASNLWPTTLPLSQPAAPATADDVQRLITCGETDTI